MYTCSKTYTDIPFAHRQHKHEGDCSFIHGHNWAITFTFGCKQLDDNGFVIDFGKLQFIRNWIDECLDHAFVYNADDSKTKQLLKDFPEMFKAYEVDNCSAESLAEHAFNKVTALLREHHGSRVALTAVEVREDLKNSARYCS
jgi:6-pyruvoyltetrahydropterin/6-carboxytetrahydropterin synthase